MAFQGTRINPQRFDKSQLKFYAFLLPLALFMILPVVFIINQAFKPLEELYLFPPRFFVANPTLNNFFELFRTATTTGVPLSRYFFNTLLITILTMVFTIWISVSAGFALSKKKFKGKDTVLNINQIALMFVRTAVVIPSYFVVINLGLNNNFLVHIIPYIVMPVGVFLVKQFIDQIPDAIIEAARIDGASDFQIVLRMIIPLTQNALATVGILTFQATWGAMEASNLYIQDETLRSFAFYLNTLTSSSGNTIAGAGIAAAAGLIMFLPNLLIFIVMQSRVMNTLVHSGIK